MGFFSRLFALFLLTAPPKKFCTSCGDRMKTRKSTGFDPDTGKVVLYGWDYSCDGLGHEGWVFFISVYGGR